jgi:hypothetical protein
MSSGVSSSFSFSITTIRGFEGAVTSFAMSKFSPALTKTRKVVRIKWYLRSEGVKAFYLAK